MLCFPNQTQLLVLSLDRLEQGYFYVFRLIKIFDVKVVKFNDVSNIGQNFTLI
jgi:hypothetical protein